MAPAGGALVNWTEIGPADDREFQEWYVRDHIPQRLALPGFVGARRYRIATAPPGLNRYLTVYGVTGVQALRSPEYVQVLNEPTPWSRRMLPRIRGGSRTACATGFETRLGFGSAAAVVYAPLGTPGAAAVPEAGTLESLAGREGVCGVQLLRGDPAVTGAKDGSTESAIGTPRSPSVAWLVLVDGTDVAAVADAAAGLGSGSPVLEELTLLYVATATAGR